MERTVNLLRYARTSVFGWLCVVLSAGAWAQVSAPVRAPTPAQQVAGAAMTPIMAATRAGQRVGAVGDYGVVLLSDDGGKSYRQARSVPVNVLLTDVSFIDDKRGHASGHDGVVLATGDAGETWSLLRHDAGKSGPLMSVWFATPELGFAVGRFGEAIRTLDGGKTWTPMKVGQGDAADRHLYKAFPGPAGSVMITAESGLVYRSDDQGATWAGASTGNKGSLWTGLTLKDGSVVVAGMRGHFYRSADGGRTWRKIDVGSTASLTGMAQMSDGRLLVVGMNGTVVESADGGVHVKAGTREDRLPLTAVVDAGKGTPALFSFVGAVPVGER